MYYNDRCSASESCGIKGINLQRGGQNENEIFFFVVQD